MAAPIVDHAVLGASDLARATAFYEAFGFEVLRRGSIDADVAAVLYGIDAELDEAVLGVAGATGGMLRIVATPLPGRGHVPFARGGHALDLYTTDIARSIAIAEQQGAVHGPVADYPFGPVHLTQAQAMAPDDVALVFVGINHRLPSALDLDPQRVHSDLHSLVACVADIDAETAFWIDVVQLEQQSAFPIDVPAVSEFMMLPRHAPVRMSVLRGPGATPPRFELMQFTDAEGPELPDHPLLPGSIACGLRVDDFDATLARLSAGGAEVDGVVTVPGLLAGVDRAAHVLTPGGVSVEVRTQA
jgi:catechol 2,3-dioxygenase-like lactoylglutathione lyase family enzyme